MTGCSMAHLAARKRQLVAQADLHRQLIRLEQLQWRARVEAPAFAVGRQGWLLGGAILGGLLLARKWRGLARWLPTLVAVGRILKS